MVPYAVEPCLSHILKHDFTCQSNARMRTNLLLLLFFNTSDLVFFQSYNFVFLKVSDYSRYSSYATNIVIGLCVAIYHHRWARPEKNMEPEQA